MTPALEENTGLVVVAVLIVACDRELEVWSPAEDDRRNAAMR